MKPLKDFVIKNEFDVDPLSSQIRYVKKLNIDWDVYLESKGKNLQRDLVWNIDQKRELIISVLMKRHIPNLAFINSIDKSDERKEVYLLIDGKQRLSTIFDFIDDKFTLVIDDVEYTFSELTDDYKHAINNYYIGYYVLNEPYHNRITDQQKIDWFKFINFAGTPQDKDYLLSL